ncbi:alpha,alpha-trehalase TreF [Novosphingobium profundi]|uniref:alpha,alpha-trehalase TreF n=1 Tax=Novosphingobium profundi TaxID=1774954 RepID=UPI001BDB4DD5|nr:alpha,alpha-trehalase TreF [Novosphingobium profundi]MBT0667962.1 alpha,alpha-trehalase TreF [Novosphingobium profundi]
MKRGSRWAWRCGILAACLLATPLAPAGARAGSAADEVASPARVYGDLYRAVERARVFPDSKTFADMVPRAAPEAILAEFRREKPQGRDALAAFVAAHFHSADEKPAKRPSMRAHIRQLWPLLARPPMAAEPGSSRLGLDSAYVVAGGRFQEMYYWDSYFTMLGLKADGQHALVESMLASFAGLVERYGHVPNGTRSYYLTRSQPPFLALMMDLSDARDPVVLRRRLDALRREYAYWMAGADCLGADGACQHVVRMPDGSLLNRYWDASDTPRDEAYVEDEETARAASARVAAHVYRDLRAGAESGWDYSSRWLGDGRTLATIRTTQIVPVDLNSLLWNLETSIARRCKAAGDEGCAADFTGLAARRKAAIERYLWSPAEQRFADWDRAAKAPTAAISAAALYPLFVGLASAEEARASARLARKDLLAPGGLRTTTVATGQQWDEPNGWAPLAWIAVTGFDRYGDTALSDTIARRWVTTVSTFYACTGRMVEKYDVDAGKAGGGGEYPVQDGFGWTNGVTRALLDRAGMEEAVVASCPSGS